MKSAIGKCVGALARGSGPPNECRAPQLSNKAEMGQNGCPSGRYVATLARGYRRSDTVALALADGDCTLVALTVTLPPDGTRDGAR